jgi:hypothetical protein
VEPTILLLVAGVVLLLLNARGIMRTSRHQLSLWRAVAGSAGLSQIQERQGGAHPAEITARAGPLRVSFTSYDHGDGGTHMIVATSWPAPLAGFTLHPDRTDIDSPAKRAEIVIGDEAFDEAFLVGGPSTAVRAWLDAETRRCLLELQEKGDTTVADGALHLEVARKKNTALRQILDLQMEAAQRLARHQDIPRALADHVRHDPHHGVRLSCLLALTRELRGNRHTNAALRAACGDSHPEVRLHAALALGLEGQGTLFDLAERLADDGCAARAIAALERKLDTPRVLAILERAIETRRLEAARACLERVGRTGGADTVPKLIHVMASDEALAADAARAIGAAGLPSGEEPLIAALSREHDLLRVAAAEALGHVGSAAAVVPLREAAERSPADKTLGRATRQAIAEIQARLTGATPGQVSLARDGAGQLSVAGDEAGRLSDPETER